ncbi:amino acid permease [Microbulbifer spongiae]|uniref:APC family permease n=1 Tax=Microbulbifer spongiae TaxID=2944933 RepID=A0ABY9E8C3_9GAMM|nr:amino acid permease [Microbulbifer sp. MI-G]WKD49260.1 APC family permease [Microbulbifer sp. MI-G]
MHEVERNANKLTALPLIFITAALFMTLRNMPAMAETGMHMIFFNFITVFLFLIPAALVSAELATGWPHNGVYGWVKAAFGPKLGFLAVWLQWVQSIFGITSILAYVGGSLAYVLAPELGNNKYFIALTIFTIYWLATIMNFKGAKRSGLISSVALIAGVITPTLLLIGCSTWYFLQGNPIQVNYQLTQENFLPSFTDTTGLLLFLSFVFGFVGIEVSASHARDVVNPQRNYPIALFTAAFIGFVLTLLGGLAIAAVVPAESIDSINGATQAFSLLLQHYQLSWLIPVIAFLIAMGAAGQVSTWVVGPIKGLWAAGMEGNLPPYLQKTNQYDVPVKLLLIQATLISVIGLLFLSSSDVNTIFLMLTSTAIVLYAMMYILMFLAAIRLRYSHPEVHRAYKIPGGKLGIWGISLTGGISIFACLLIGFIPPKPNPWGFWGFESLLISVCIVSIIAAFIIINRRKSKWIGKSQDSSLIYGEG